MKKKKLLIPFLAITFIFLFQVTAYASTAQELAKANAERLGIFTLIPPLIAIVLAFITKNVIISLFVGVLSGSLLIQIQGNNLFYALFKSFLDFVQRILASLSDPWNAGIILQCLTIGGVIALITKMGGAKAIAESLAKKAKTPVSAQLITWLLGLIVFFDDYANSLIVGPIMRPVTDKMKISRERLSFIIDATAAPVAGIALISTWIGYELSLIKDAFSSSLGQDVDAFGLFIQTIPYRFYNILILLFIVITAVMMKEFGPMYHAERRARTTGKVLRDGAQPMVSEEATNIEAKEGIKLSIWNAIIPIGVLIIGAFAGFYYNGYTNIMGGEDEALKALFASAPYSFKAVQQTFSNSDASLVLFQSALLASIVAIIMAVGKKILTLSEAIDTWISGMKSLVITGAILLLAWSLSGVIKDLGTANYLVSILQYSLPPFLLPTLIFILGSVISFATGTSYGTMGILMPLTIPLAHAISPDMNYIIMSAGAVLTGAIFGDHCSPISDTTILSSMGAACDHLDHTKTQIYYALFVAAITIVFGYIPVGFGLSIKLVLPGAIVIMALLVFIVGKPVEDINAKTQYESHTGLEEKAL
ncbi:transporter, NhaC family [Clostridium amylolyticum]|uniref:Transporter, NhaC family n=1 Tax=Clostridium amylolyticum TaxID=1121298 RepID=A0A1M6EFN4_9CLOT|nr:Na+/H+ antiporter NhaC family protein [Clostridium amylolyticum]SHI84108.1 transporter, NhaC family [Clostridium amylolyticum]